VDTLSEAGIEIRAAETLKPRAEVHRLIAGWFAKWQRGLPREETQRRADFFMQSMPAWARN
jgi:hypothetical protein